MYQTLEKNKKKVRKFERLTIFTVVTINENK